MTTPVITRKAQSDGEKMEMTTPVITKKVSLRHVFYSVNVHCFLYIRYNHVLPFWFLLEDIVETGEEVILSTGHFENVYKVFLVWFYNQDDLKLSYNAKKIVATFIFMLNAFYYFNLKPFYCQRLLLLFENHFFFLGSRNYCRKISVPCMKFSVIELN